MLALAIIATVLSALMFILKLYAIENKNYIDISLLFDIFNIVVIWVLYGGTC
jgi:hypothetical protein